MDNAIKFTPNQGTITLHLVPTQSDVLIKVEDTGKGISEEEQSVIFERYQKAGSTKQNAGAGLGLAIAKKILELHDATIRVQSKLNQGTTFMFQLPAYSA